MSFIGDLKDGYNDHRQFDIFKDLVQIEKKRAETDLNPFNVFGPGGSFAGIGRVNGSGINPTWETGVGPNSPWLPGGGGGPGSGSSFWDPFNSGSTFQPNQFNKAGGLAAGASPFFPSATFGPPPSPLGFGAGPFNTSGVNFGGGPTRPPPHRAGGIAPGDGAQPAVPWQFNPNPGPLPGGMSPMQERGAPRPGGMPQQVQATNKASLDSQLQKTRGGKTGGSTLPPGEASRIGRGGDFFKPNGPVDPNNFFTPDGRVADPNNARADHGNGQGGFGNGGSFAGTEGMTIGQFQVVNRLAQTIRQGGMSLDGISNPELRDMVEGFMNANNIGMRGPDATGTGRGPTDRTGRGRGPGGGRTRTPDGGGEGPFPDPDPNTGPIDGPDDNDPTPDPTDPVDTGPRPDGTPDDPLFNPDPETPIDPRFDPNVFQPAPGTLADIYMDLGDQNFLRNMLTDTSRMNAFNAMAPVSTGGFQGIGGNAFTSFLDAQNASAFMPTNDIAGLQQLSNLSGQSAVDSLSKSLGYQQPGSFQGALQDTMFGSALQNASLAGLSPDRAEAAQLQKMRSAARPENRRQENALMDRLQSMGMLGGGSSRTGEALRGFQEAKDQQDLNFQTEAFGRGQQMLNNASSRAGQLSSGGNQLRQMQEALAQGNFNRFRDSSAIFQNQNQNVFDRNRQMSDLFDKRAQDRFARTIGLEQMGQENINRSLNRALQASGGIQSLDAEGRNLFGLGLNTAIARANARLGSGSPLAAFGGAPARGSTSSGDAIGAIASLMSGGK